MAKLGIFTGTSPDAGDGDTLLDGAIKINSNFNEVYTLLGDGTNLTSGIVTSIVAGNNISISGPSGQVTVNAGAGGTWSVSSTGIHTTKNVGIGSNLPTSKLVVDGNTYITGILTASTLYGNGSNLSGIVTGIQAGSNITILQNPSGNFIITSTASGGGGGTGYWEQNATGINTTSNVGIGTTTASSALTVKGNTSLETLNVSGVSTFSDDVLFEQVGGTSKYIQWDKSAGILNFGDTTQSTFGESNDLRIFHNNVSDEGHSFISHIGPGNLRISSGPNGSTEIQHNTTTKLETIGAGVTVTGTTFTNQLSVSGVSTFSDSTFSGTINANNVGIGTTNPQTPLQIDNVYGVKTGLGTFVASAGIAHTLDSFTISSTDFKTSEYTIHINYNSNIQTQKLLVMQNGSDAYSQEYAIMFDPSIIVSIGATITSGELRLEVTPETGITGLTTYRFTRQTML